MAITFTQEQQKERNLMIILVAVVLVTVVVAWLGFFGGAAEKAAVAPSFILRKAEINFETLKKSELQALNPFPEIAAFEGEMGRENPFIPY